MQRFLSPITFVQALATVLLERGLYFYTEDRLAFSDSENLGLALLFGSMYTIGALRSHGQTQKRGERPTLQAILIGLLLLHVTLVMHPTRLIVWGGFAAIGLLEGMKWPIIESYVTAGATPKQAMRALGRFNLAWSTALPIGLIVSGPLISSGSPTSFIVLAAVIHVGTLLLIRGLPLIPTHLADDHPERPDAATAHRYRALMVSARWSMMGGCAMIFLLAPLIPTIFTERLGHDLRWAPGLSSVMDLSRMVLFALMGALTVWRGRAWLLGVAALGLPVGFLLLLFATTTTHAIVGQVLFGFSGGMVYYAAIYHGMVLHNASVEASGKHESFMGLGFAVGPAVGLLGIFLQRVTGDPRSGMLLAVGPCLLLCLAAALLPLWGLRKSIAATATGGAGGARG